MSKINLDDGKHVCRFLLNHHENFIKPGLADPSSVQVEQKTENWNGADFVTTLDTEGQDRIAAFLGQSFSRFEPYICGEEGFGDFNNPEGVKQIAHNIKKMSTGFAAIIDPIDGTNNVKRYLSGENKNYPRYGVMSTIFNEGEPEASFILADDGGDTTMLMAIKDRGAFWVNPRTLHASRISFDARETEKPRVMTVVKAWNSQYQSIINKNIDEGKLELAQEPPVTAAVETMRFMRGDCDASAWRRNTLWDQTQAMLLAKEAGGAAHLLNGHGFSLESFHTNGVLVASSGAMWDKARNALIGDVTYTQCYNDKELEKFNSGNDSDRRNAIKQATLTL